MSKESLTLDEFWKAKQALIHVAVRKGAGSKYLTGISTAMNPFVVPVLTLPCVRCAAPSPPKHNRPMHLNSAVDTWVCPTHGRFQAIEFHMGSGARRFRISLYDVVALGNQRYRLDTTGQMFRTFWEDIVNTHRVVWFDKSWKDIEQWEAQQKVQNE